ncbi:MAG TPA: EAL domain-containing protein [Candidatus Dormibacteraeota bacterium]|nr:EAL domain-containing protein [Candidatus Dormibacteraeota bacterium]
MTTIAPTYKILLIEKDVAAADAIRAALATASGGSFDLKLVSGLPEGIQWLSQNRTSAILLGIAQSFTQAFEAFDQLFGTVPEIPILILGDNASEDLAREAVARGAQDYLLPDHLAYSLPRALRNAIERKAVEDAFYLEKERSLVTLNSIGDAVLCTDISGDISYLNPAAEALTGWRRDEAAGLPLAKVFRIIDGATRQTAKDPMERAVKENRTVGLTANCILIRRDGIEHSIEDSAAPIHDRAGHVIGAVIVFHDVSLSRAMSVEMTRLAQHDALTGLPNRALLLDRIAQSISLAHRQNRSIAVIFLDLDHFKHVNDSLGHDSGDKLLQSVSSRLVAAVRGSDTVSRLGGDEFVILLSEIARPEDAATSAKKILLSLSTPCSIGGTDLHINGSIGVSIYPDDGRDAETLIKNADTAMYCAKETGRNNWQLFKNEMNLRSVERRSIEGDLHHAIERTEFLLNYQSKVDLNSGAITGVEALVRWQQPGRELVLPSGFISIAEDCGLIVQIGRWVLHEACRQAREWQEAGLPFGRISVNVSSAEFRAETFIAEVKRALGETGLDARHLDIELTENVLIANDQSVVAILQELKRMGIHLAVDDFGTGYSSLSYLQQFPVDVLKIDQSFVHRITGDAADSPIVGAIIDMAKNLKLRVIAEGIETQQQLAFLQALHCAEGQGFIFGQPMAAEQFALLLQQGFSDAVLH